MESAHACRSSKRPPSRSCARQLPDGGFNIYVEGPSELNATIKAYFALKVAGTAPEDPRMRKARERILALGGLQAANSYVKLNLNLFNLYPREYCPSVPPEVMLMPARFLYQMSAWTRAIVVSLAIVHAANPCRPVPAGFNLEELIDPRRSLALSSTAASSPGTIFSSSATAFSSIGSATG